MCVGLKWGGIRQGVEQRKMWSLININKIKKKKKKKSAQLRQKLTGSISSGLAHRSCGPDRANAVCTLCWQPILVMCKRFPGE